MQNSDEQFQRQIQYILNQLVAEPVEGQQDQEEEKHEDEVEDEEEEEDEDEYGDDEEGGERDQEEDGEYNDTIKIEGVPVGEDLLARQFILAEDQAMQQTQTISRRIEETRE